MTLTEVRTLKCLYCGQLLSQSAGYTSGNGTYGAHPLGIGECHFVIELPTKEKP